MRIDTMESIIRLFKAASKDETRSHICGVFVTQKKAYSTDGYIAATCDIDDESITEEMFFPNESLTLLKSTVIHAKSMKHRLVPPLAYAGFTKEINTCYPSTPIENMLKAKKETIEVKLNAKLLFDLVSSMQTQNGKHQDFMVTLNYRKRQPCRVTLKNNQKGIIMPTT